MITRTEKFFLVFLVVYLVVLLATINTNYILWDEGSFVTSGLYHAGADTNYDETFFRPPLIPLLLGIIFSFSSNYILVGKLLIIATSIGALIFLYKITKELFDEKVAFLAAVLLALFPLYFFYSKIIFVDVPAFFFSFISIYYFLKKRTIPSGVFLGIAFLAKYHIGALTGLIFILFFLLNKTKFIDKKLEIKNTSFLKLIVSAIVITIPWFIYNQIRWEFFADPLITKVSIFAGEVPIRFSYFFDSFLEFLPIPYLVFILGIVVLAKNRNYKNIFVLLWFFVFFIFILTLSWKELRFFIYAAPALCIMLSVAIFKIGEKYKKLFFLVLAACLISGVAYGVSYSQYGYNPGYGNEAFDYETAVEVSEFLKENTNEGDLISANSLWPVIAYYSGRGMVIPESFEDIDKTSYLVYYNTNFFFTDLSGVQEKYELVKQYKNDGKEIYLFRV